MKQVWGITMVKNEEDIIYHSIIHHAEEGFSGIIVADNLSTDNTLEEIKRAQSVLQDSPCKVIIIEDNEPGYFQSRKMTTLARLSHEQGAEWIIPFDADELWFSPLRLLEFFEQLPAHINVVEADLWNHYGTGLDSEGMPFETMQWKHEKLRLPKVAFKWQPDAVIDMGNHSVSMKGIKSTTGLEIRHFPYRTFEQFKRKAIQGDKAIKAAGLHKQYCDHWQSYAGLIEKWGDEVVKREVFEKHFWHFSPVDAGMIHDPAPFRRFKSV